EIIGPADITRLTRELNSLDDFLVGSSHKKTADKSPPRITRLLELVAKENQVNLLEAEARTGLAALLKKTADSSPLLHISFAADPPPKALERILIWLRENIHPHVLLQVGLQPGIAAGCVLRTPNKLFDMSLRSNLKKQEPYLAKLIAGAVHGK
ncbi:MAG: hypothetical protein WD887_02805, partial [Candidatus Saccharimonadales bacterium]